MSRRGYHLSREYAVDPLEVLFVRDVMRTNIAALPSSMLLKELDRMFSTVPRSQHLYPISDSEGYMIGTVTQGDIRKELEEKALKGDDTRLAEVVQPDPTTAYRDEPLTVVVNRMAKTGITEFPVVEQREAPSELMKQVKREANAKWSQVRNPDCWNGVNGGFNQSNAKMICNKCHREFPFDLKCAICGSSALVLGTAAAAPGIFCSVCHEGQWHWDCPNCGRRQDFAESFFYNRKTIAVRPRYIA